MKKLVLIFLLVAVAIGVTTQYFLKDSVTYVSPQLVAGTEAQALADKVGILILLPTDEVPTVATVDNPKALKDQAFFIDAKKGDKVLIYAKASKAILYDPVANKIINVAPVNFGVDKKLSQSVLDNRLNVEDEENTF